MNKSTRKSASNEQNAASRRDVKPLYARTWALRLARFENRLARRLKKWADRLQNDAKRRCDQAVKEWTEVHPIG